MNPRTPKGPDLKSSSFGRALVPLQKTACDAVTWHHHILSYEYTLLYGINNDGIHNNITRSEKGKPFLRLTMNEITKEMEFEDLLVDEIEME